MAKAKEAQQLSFTLPNKVGQLSAVSDLIAAAKVNIEAILAIESGAQAEFRVVTAKNPKVKKALAPLGVEVKEEAVLCIDMANKAGSLGKLAKRLADASVNINRLWATSFKGKTATAVLQTSDDKKALSSLTKKKKMK
ncbi:MAG TPA: hypothetical protein VMU36_09330 [Spirochaetia bacterium]|nr:hypothetical protein [Spirochaetia bacterium]